MRTEGTRLKRDGRRALIAALASTLLASCATTESDLPFGLAMSGISPETTQMQVQTQMNASPQNDFASVSPSATVFIIEEDDPSLPDSVIAAPQMRPGSETQTLAFATTNASEAQNTTSLQAQHQAILARQAAAEDAPASQEPAEQQPDTSLQVQEQEQVQTVAYGSEPGTPAKKRSFLSALFSPAATSATPSQNKPRPLIDPSTTTPAMASAASTAQPLVKLDGDATASPSPAVAREKSMDTNPLPGVRQNGLFEITRRSGIDDDSDIDLHEGEEPYYQLASAAGMARLAPNGLMKQTDNVDVACLKPSLVRVLKAVEKHYGRKVVVTSGYRSPDKNRRARGARNSLHMYCAAADVQVEGVSKWELAQYVRSMPGRGGVGTYCHTESVHIDVGPERDWNWRCRRRK